MKRVLDEAMWGTGREHGPRAMGAAHLSDPPRAPVGLYWGRLRGMPMSAPEQTPETQEPEEEQQEPDEEGQNKAEKEFQEINVESLFTLQSRGF